MGAGTETGDLSVPKTIGVPMRPGMKLGMYVAWHNDTGQDLEGVQLKIVMLWTPKNQNPQPVNSLPIYMDVNLTVGGSNTFDVPPGVSEKAHEFTLPVSGRILGIGGHLHDYGVRVRLEDAETGKVITTVQATRDSAGKVTKVSQKLYGVSGEGLKLKANHRYRVVGVYDNPTGKTLVRGAMAHMAGLFVPDDIGDWPKIDPANPEYQRDMAALQVRGTGTAEGGQTTSMAGTRATSGGRRPLPDTDGPPEVSGGPFDCRPACGQSVAASCVFEDPPGTHPALVPPAPVGVAVAQDAHLHPALGAVDEPPFAQIHADVSHPPAAVRERRAGRRARGRPPSCATLRPSFACSALVRGSVTPCWA